MSRVKGWSGALRVLWSFHRFRFGPQSGSLKSFPPPALRTERVVFSHSALQVDHTVRTWDILSPS
ncbi:MAG: hypothetical protein OXF06_11020 [Bacteroidetes bacterium]|nr:hypothetical protein [Bacteroidota bacterium]